MAAENATKTPVVVVLDVETTGLKDDDRVVQIACLKIDENGTKQAWTRYINPCVDVDRQREAFRIHQISPELLLTKPTFEQVADHFLEFLKGVDIVVCHNALFDWSMLWNEFKRIKHPKAVEFAETFQWLDVLRLAILHFQYLYPKPAYYRLVSLKEFFNVNNMESLASELCGDDVGDAWRKGEHDAMYDVLTTYEVLKHCMGEMNFDDLVQKQPKAFIDTTLFIAMQKLMGDMSTSEEDLMPFAQRAKQYFTTARPRGKVLKDLTKDFLLRMTDYHRDDDRTDRRIVLIYEAAYLDPPCEIPSASPETPKTDTTFRAVEGVQVENNSGESESAVSGMPSTSQAASMKDMKFNAAEGVQTQNKSGINESERDSGKEFVNFNEEKESAMTDHTASQEVLRKHPSFKRERDEQEQLSNENDEVESKRRNIIDLIVKHNRPLVKLQHNVHKYDHI